MTGPPKEEKPEKKQKPAPKPARKRRRKGPVNVAKIPQGRYHQYFSSRSYVS